MRLAPNLPWIENPSYDGGSEMPPFLVGISLDDSSTASKVASVSIYPTQNQEVWVRCRPIVVPSQKELEGLAECARLNGWDVG